MPHIKRVRGIAQAGDALQGADDHGNEFTMYYSSSADAAIWFGFNQLMVAVSPKTANPVKTVANCLRLENCDHASADVIVDEDAVEDCVIVHDKFHINRDLARTIGEILIAFADTGKLPFDDYE